MADNYSIVQKQDSEGFTFNVNRFTLANGEVIDSPSMFYHLNHVLDNLDELEARSNDVWLTSYPKSGSHWIYEILLRLMSGSLNRDDSRKEFSMLEFVKGIDALNRIPSPRLLNSHIRLKYISPQISKAQKMIHLVRNPKSVAVSYFFHKRKMAQNDYNGTFHSYLPTFLHNNAHASLYGNWFQYIQEWWEFAKRNENVYIIFYEDLKKDPDNEVRKLATFMGFDYEDKFISGIVKDTAFDAMKGGTNYHQSFSFIDAAPHPSKFVRKGIVKDWKNHFTVSENEMFDEMYARELKCADLKERIRFQ